MFENGKCQLDFFYFFFLPRVRVLLTLYVLAFYLVYFKSL